MLNITKKCEFVINLANRVLFHTRLKFHFGNEKNKMLLEYDLQEHTNLVFLLLNFTFNSMFFLILFMKFTRIYRVNIAVKLCYS